VTKNGVAMWAQETHGVRPCLRVRIIGLWVGRISAGRAPKIKQARGPPRKAFDLLAEVDRKTSQEAMFGSWTGTRSSNKAGENFLKQGAFGGASA